MAEAKTGDTVRVHYTGKLNGGDVFDSSRGSDPIQFEVGSGDVIPGFENAVTGMEPGDEKEITIPSDEAYGPRRDDLIAVVERNELPDHIDPEVGQQLQMRQGDQTFVVTVTEVSDDSVTLDANHPLAGQDLTFELELVDIA